MDADAPALLARLRALPPRGVGVLLLKGVIAGLLAIGAVVLVNVLVPLGAELGRVLYTLVILLCAWAAALLVPFLVRLRPLWLLAAVFIPCVPLLTVLALAALWGGNDVVLGRILAVAGILAVAALLAAPSFEMLARRRSQVGAAACLAATAVSAAIAALAVAGVDLGARVTDSGLRGLLAFPLASLALLLPRTVRPAARLLGVAALLQFAAMQVLDPWVDGDLSERLVMAGIVLLFVLILAAVTVAILPARKRPADRPREG